MTTPFVKDWSRESALLKEKAEKAEDILQCRKPGMQEPFLRAPQKCFPLTLHIPCDVPLLPFVFPLLFLCCPFGFPLASTIQTGTHPFHPSAHCLVHQKHQQRPVIHEAQAVHSKDLPREEAFKQNPPQRHNSDDLI